MKALSILLASLFSSLNLPATNALERATTDSYGYRRKAPHNSKYDGTVNWELLSHGQQKFSPRHSHATAIFKCPDEPSEQCIWLTGGYSESHRTWDLDMENENSDVWWSRDGAVWNQVTELYGDFRQGIGNWDAKVGGYVAPWYARFGHSLSALDGNGDGIADVMVLTGGFSPMPSKDTWITRDGIKWEFDGYAPWPKRAQHAAVVFQNKLWIFGGTPFSNDVWVGTLVKEPLRDAGYRMEWKQVLKEAPWSPRYTVTNLIDVLNS